MVEGDEFSVLVGKLELFFFLNVYWYSLSFFLHE